jgi:uncharacterized membrane protein
VTGIDPRGSPVIAGLRRIVRRGHPVWTPVGRAWHWLRRQRPLSYPGTVLGTGFLCMSLTPSLLPRTWLIQGLVSGFSATTGYGIGSAAGFVVAEPVRRWRRLRRLMPGRRLRRSAWQVLAIIAVPAVGALLYQGSRWQRDLYLLMGEPSPTRPGYLRVLVVTLAVFGTVLLLARCLRAASHEVARQLTRWIPEGASRAGGGVTVALLTLGLLNTAVYDPLMSSATASSESVNDQMLPQVLQPLDPGRSGSPQSAVGWSSLGQQGRAFVSGGPTTAQLQAFNHAAALPPVRVYAGERSAPDVEAEAALAVRELVRTGAFSRKVLCVITTTGTGWVDPTAAATLEYLYNGDSALVAIQYSVLPSWISFWLERNKATNAGRELFNQVYAEWVKLPPPTRPRLLLFGESLGSLGGEAAFHGMTDLTGLVDGALWAGPTQANPMWSALVHGRDPGSPEVRPVVDGGTTVRFADTAADLTDPRPWPVPRVLYLQHASDPATWWSPDLLVRRPDWLSEPRGADVLPAMRWYPFVTFWQVSADLTFADDAPPGHGHHYGGEFGAAWAAIAAPPWWTARDTDRLALLVGRPD